MPKFDDPAWRGPSFVVDEKPGDIERVLRVEERELVRRRNRFRKRSEDAAIGREVRLSLRNSLQIPEFPEDVLLTNEQQTELAPYGGGARQISYDRQDAPPEAAYRVVQSVRGVDVFEY